MKNIKIVFESGDGFVERCIKWLTGRDVNHVAITFESNDWEAPWVVEASTRGVRCRPDWYKWKYVFEVNAGRYPEIVDDIRAASKYIGEKYDFTSFFAFGWLLLWGKLLKIKLRRPWRSAKGQFCSEFIGRIVERKLKLHNPQWIAPGVLLDRCRERKELFKEVAPEV